MPAEGSLRPRITRAFALLAITVCAVFSVAVYFTVETAEGYLFVNRLRQDAEWLSVQLQRGQPVELPPGQLFYRQSEAPADLRSLEPGYHELRPAPHSVHVLVQDIDGQRYVLVRREGDYYWLEGLLFLALAIGSVTGLAAALWLGRLTAGRVIAPVTALADAVVGRAAAERLPSLGARDEIGALARAFAERTTELNRYLIRERLFVGDVSHELRTPLTVVQGAAELIEARAGEATELRQAGQRIQRAAADMTEQVTAFLLLSRAPETLDAPRIALAPLLERERERCRALLAGKPVVCRIEADPSVHAHARPELATVAIGNLLRNACQYTERGEVRARLLPGCLIVEDSGPGLPDVVRERLFERFVRGGEERVAGSGLGLAIVRRVAEHLSWEIRFEDAPEGGSRFVLRFPAA